MDEEDKQRLLDLYRLHKAHKAPTYKSLPILDQILDSVTVVDFITPLDFKIYHYKEAGVTAIDNYKDGYKEGVSFKYGGSSTIVEYFKNDRFILKAYSIDGGFHINVVEDADFTTLDLDGIFEYVVRN